MCLKRGQAALEFLMVYGWAILVVLIAIGALVYFGVLRSDRFLPDACFIAPGWSCDSVKITTSDITIVATNSQGSAVTNVVWGVVGCVAPVPFTWENGQRVVRTLTGCGNGPVGGRFRQTFMMNYTDASGIQRALEGLIQGRVEAGGAATDAGVCQNAQSGGLCSGLDLVYGEGYRAVCCAEHGLCC